MGRREVVRGHARLSGLQTRARCAVRMRMHVTSGGVVHITPCGSIVVPGGAVADVCLPAPHRRQTLDTLRHPRAHPYRRAVTVERGIRKGGRGVGVVEGGCPSASAHTHPSQLAPQRHADGRRPYSP
eukprot:scaffold2774_cov137-Isochrysis_galbana.AAC.2